MATAEWFEGVLGIRKPEDDEHVHLHEFDQHDQHEDQRPGPGSATLRHPDVPGVVVVNARSEDHLRSHLASVSIWMAAVERQPRVAFLDTILAESVATVTGSPIGDLERSGESDSTLGQVLGAHADSVVECAVAELGRARPDLSPEHAASVVLPQLGEPVSALAWTPSPAAGDDAPAFPAAVVTTFGLDHPEHDLMFSIRDIGSITKDEEKLWGPTAAWSGVHCKVTTKTGRVKWRLYYGSSDWNGGQSVKSCVLKEGKSRGMSDGSASGSQHKWYLNAHAEMKSSVELTGKLESGLG